MDLTVFKRKVSALESEIENYKDQISKMEKEIENYESKAQEIVEAGPPISILQQSPRASKSNLKIYQSNFTKTEIGFRNQIIESLGRSRINKSVEKINEI